MKRWPPRSSPPQLQPDRFRAAAEARAAGMSAGAIRGRPVAELAHELQVHQIELEMQNDELRRAQLALEATKDRYVDLYDFAPVGYLTLSPEGVVIEANLTGATLLSVPRPRLVGGRFARHVAPEDRDRWHQHASSVRRRGEAGRIELEMLGGEGRSFNVQLECLPVVVPGAEPLLRVAMTDVTRHTQAEADLRLAATTFEAQEGTMVTDASGVIQRVNRAFTHITGYGPEHAVGRNASLLQSGLHAPEFYAGMWDSLLSTGAWRGEVWNRRKSGEVYPEWLTIAAVRDDDGAIVRYVGSMLDISARKSREEAIEQLAFYDSLTGLPNRRLLRDRLQQAMAVSARTQRQGALMFIDLDHFKGVNDALGHVSGDLLLQQVAQRLTACVREADTVARLGGDEFVVMLAVDSSGTPSEVAARATVVGEKILGALNRPYEIAGQDSNCSASIGVALFSGRLLTADELLTRADQAMYEAKAAGRNTLRFFDAAVPHEPMRANLETDLRRAVENGELVLYYQPVVDQARRILGAEALLRWQHPSLGLLPPDAFITIAEDTGLIHAIGQWVLETACAQLVAWATDPQMARLGLSVNICARQLRDRRFVEQVLDVIDRSGADTTRLTLELTESMMLGSLGQATANMEALNARGLSFALDDFGTGYSSLAHLKQLPLEQLKIDRLFVNQMPTSPHDAAIAHAILELGRSLGLMVIAEGVETEEQLDVLVTHGCEAFQGFLFARPVPAEALRQMVHLANADAAQAEATGSVPPEAGASRPGT